MQRKVTKKFAQWAKGNRALLVTGARQVGKTYAIRGFLKDWCGDDYVELNLFENVVARQILEESKNSAELLFRLSAVVDKPLKKGKTVIFFDEIQVCKYILTIAKFLVEEGSFRYIFSGSLLGTELSGIESIPVGYMEVIEMYPMDFEEFLFANALSESIFEKVRECFDKKVPVDNIIHEKLVDMFHLYLVVGGMPAVVKKYIETNNLKDVVEEQNTINKLYKLDISRYDVDNKLYINEIFDLIPSELNNQNKRFILKDLNENLKFQKYENSFLWLKNAGVALPTYCADEPKVPLILSKSRNLFKLYHCDVGLLSAMYMDNNLQLKILKKEKDINFGAIYENAVAEELTSKGFDLYYYRNKSVGEIDFLIENKGEIIPLEIKSGKDYKRHNALTNLLTQHSEIKFAYIFSNNNVEICEKEIYLPIYMISFLQKDEVRDMIYKVDLSNLN